jgi:hypothetical protein
MEASTKEEEISLLREILKWIKFSSMPQAKAFLASILDTEQKKTVYQLSDGSKGIVEIGKLTGIKSTSTISNYWKAWEKQNLGSRIPVVGGERFKRDFDLEELGLTVEFGQTIREIQIKKDIENNINHTKEFA